VIPTMDIQWMVITESLGVEEAARWRRTQIEQVLGMSPAADGLEPDPGAGASGFGAWLARAVTTIVGRRPRRSALQALPQV
jgi:hypothetical protein